MNRPPGVTAYMWKKYLEDFAEPCQFWSSEDGDPGEIVVLPSDQSLALIRERHGWQYKKMGSLANATVRAGFVHQVRVGREFYDGGNQTQGMVWQLSKEPTPFPVHIVDPYEDLSAVRAAGGG